MRCTVLGLGRMGEALAGRLLDKNHEVTVWNRSPGKAGDLVRRGATEVRSLADATSSATLVFSSLSNDDAVRSIAFDDGGVLETLEADGLYLDCSTVSAKLADELADRFGPDRYVALPILGAPTAVASGKAIYLVGGAPETIERLDELLGDLSDTVHRYGAAPLAAVAKVTSNLMLLTSIVGLAESFAVGRSGGLEDEQLRELLSSSPMVAPGLKNRFEGVLSGEQEPWWTATLGAKDAGLALELAGAVGVSLPVSSAVRSRYEALASKDSEADIAAVSTLYAG